MDVRPGYKRTELGVVPDEWELKPFRELFTFQNGVNADKDSYGQGTRFINVLEPITYSHIHGPEIPGRVTLPEFVVASAAVKRGDVLFNRTSETDTEIGLAATYVGTERVVFGGFVIRGRPIGKDLDTLYSGYALRAPLIRSQIIPMGQGAIRANIGQGDLKRVIAPIPPLPEQRAIAAALSDVDSLIGGLDRLIAKKRDLYTGAMQRLLTGKTRLPGFTVPWQVKRLGDHVSFLRNGVHSRAQLTVNDPVCYLHYGDIHVASSIRLDLSKAMMPRLPTAAAARLTRLEDGDVVFVDASEDLVGVGKSLEIEGANGIEAVAGQHTIAARFDKVVLADGFKGYLQFVPTFIAHLRRLAAGTKVYATNRKHIASAEIALPEPDEQTAIARVLSDMEAEIAALEARLAKTRDLKQAMMQALLTGRVRLPVSAVETCEPEAAHA